MCKKILTLLLTGVLMVSLVACGTSDVETKQDSNSAGQSTGETVTANDEGENAICRRQD